MQNLLIRMPLLGHGLRAELAHADVVAPAPARKGDGAVHRRGGRGPLVGALALVLPAALVQQGGAAVGDDIHAAIHRRQVPAAIHGVQAG